MFKIGLSPSLYKALGKYQLASEDSFALFDYTFILPSDNEPWLRNRWRQFHPVEVESLEEVIEIIRQLESMEKSSDITN